MLYRAALFDLDGTLLDTLEDLAEACNRVRAGLDLPPHPVEAYRRFVGDGARVLVVRMLPENLRDRAGAVEAALAGFQREYAACWQTRTRPYPGIADMLDELSAAGLRLAVLSNKPDFFTKLCVATLLARWSFDPVLGQREGVPKKPDPAGALEAARLMGVTPAETIFVGDSDVDMATAKAAGMTAVGALWGFRGADELKMAGADELAAKPVDIARFSLRAAG